MSPTDLEEFLFEEPFQPLRLTLASGDQVSINSNRRVLIAGLALHYGLSDDPDSRIGKRARIISIPNIVLIEPINGRGGGGGTRRGRRR